MLDKTKRFYNKIAPVYSLVTVFLKPYQAALINKINTEPAGKLLEIGVGTGAHLPLYKNHEITGIDISKAMLKRAGKHKGDLIQIREMNGECLDFGDEVFDYAVLSHVIAVTEKPERMLNEIFRVLKPNGKLFILNHFTPDNALKYMDKAFNPLGKALHFKPVFFQHELHTLQRFSMVTQESIGKLSYFKLIILQKP